MADATPLFCVDMGTTRTRVWVCEGERVWAQAARDFGVRDVARGGTREDLSTRLQELLAEALSAARTAGMIGEPERVAAAGMITSPLGLATVPHVQAPAGVDALAAAVQPVRLDDGLELLLVPGVVTGGLQDVAASDVMRGEEVLVLGLGLLGVLAAGGAVLNLGSHWKLVWTDAEGRIAGSRTTLAGEMIHAISTQTILATALPDGRPEALDAEWLRLGAAEEAKSGLSRALFCVRLLELAGTTSAEQRMSFAYGAFLEAEMRALPLDRPGAMCLVGGPAVAKAWQERLAAAGVIARVVDEAERDAAYLAGLRAVMSAAGTVARSA